MAERILSVRKGHEYRVVVSDLDAGRPLWVRGTGRKETDLDQFFATLGDDVNEGIQLAVMDLEGKASLKKLLKANKRLNTAYVLKESLAQLWDYRTGRGARTCFDHWKESLKWQRLPAYEKFAAMVERHWDGIAAYCRPENKVSLGMVEGINNKIRVIQRKAYGYRDDDYLQPKIVASFLPPLPRSPRK